MSSNSDLPLRPASVPGVALHELAAIADASYSPSGDIVASGLTNRSAEVRAGDVYAAVAGMRTHGAHFAAAARDRGAVAVLTDEAGAQILRADGIELPSLITADVKGVLGPVASRIYGHPSSDLQILGVTATSGKTTTAYLIAAGLRAAGWVPGLIGTVETVIGDRTVPHTAGASFTTPEAPDLHALLAVMREEGVTHVAMEVSSHALQLGRVGGVSFSVAGFGNLSQDHLDFHHTMDEYFGAKALLFDGRAAAHVVNIDDPYGARLAAALGEDATTISPAARPADWRAEDIRLSSADSQFTAHSADDSVEVQLQLPGEFNVANALLALAMLQRAGVAASIAAPALGGVAVPGRMERVDAGQDFLAVVDYSHKPAAVTAAIDALRAQISGRVLLVLGCGGERDAAKRPLMGAAGARGADLFVITDDNPRSEDPADIRRAMMLGACQVPQDQRGEVHDCADRGAAIVFAVSSAEPGDVVLVAGKGHETGQYIAGQVVPFDDRDALRDALRARQGTRG